MPLPPLFTLVSYPTDEEEENPAGSLWLEPASSPQSCVLTPLILPFSPRRKEEEILFQADSCSAIKRRRSRHSARHCESVPPPPPYFLSLSFSCPPRDTPYPPHYSNLLLVARWVIRFLSARAVFLRFIDQYCFQKVACFPPSLLIFHLGTSETLFCILQEGAGGRCWRKKKKQEESCVRACVRVQGSRMSRGARQISPGWCAGMNPARSSSSSTFSGV